jgi:hypothetical protein
MVGAAVGGIVSCYFTYLSTATAFMKLHLFNADFPSQFGVIFLLYGIASVVAGVIIVQSRASQPACRFDPTISGCFTGSNVVQTLMAVLIGAFALGQVGTGWGPLIPRIPSVACVSSQLLRFPHMIYGTCAAGRAELRRVCRGTGCCIQAA